GREAPASAPAAPQAGGGPAAPPAGSARHASDGPVHFCLGATGPYSDPPATALAAAGRLVSVANPARVKAYAAATGLANKTDPADARTVAQFTRDHRPPAWQPPPPTIRGLHGLVQRPAA